MHTICLHIMYALSYVAYMYAYDIIIVQIIASMFTIMSAMFFFNIYFIVCYAKASIVLTSQLELSFPLPPLLSHCLHYLPGCTCLSPHTPTNTHPLPHIIIILYL